MFCSFSTVPRLRLLLSARRKLTVPATPLDSNVVCLLCHRACVYVQCHVGKESESRRRRSSKDGEDVQNVEAENLLSSSSEDEMKSDSRRTRDQRSRLQEDCRQRASQLELQLAKTLNLLNTANKRLADHRCFEDGNGLAGPRRDGGDLAMKRNAEKRLLDATRRLKETEKARCELEDRLSAVLVELAATQDSRQKLTDELAVCHSELESLRRRLTYDRDFKRHVELMRQLNEARRLNDELRAKLDGRRGVATLDVDGRLRRKTIAATGFSVVTA